MTTETMNVHKALCELKILDDRIYTAVSRPNFLTTKKHTTEKINGKSVSEIADEIKSAYQSASDLIRRRNAIKRAVVLSNATTKVVIDGKEYTVAEAIDMKNHGLDGFKSLRERLASQYELCTRRAQQENDALETRADAYIKDLYGNTDMTKVGDEAMRRRKQYVEDQTVELVDPLDVQKLISEIDRVISAFMADVDSALSVSNALTQITIEY